MIGYTTRREFCTLVATALACSSRIARAADGPAPRTARIGVLGSAGFGDLAGAGDARDGLALGADEAVRTAAMFGLPVEFVSVLFSDDASHQAGRARHARAGNAARSLVESGAVALVAAAGAADAKAIATTATALRVPHLDLLSPAPVSWANPGGDGATPAAGEQWTLYLAPPRHARPAEPSDSSGRSDAWRHDLERYGAGQLNDRFRARFGASARMNGHAWAGWFAAKALVEACLRAAAVTPAAVRDALFTLRFDGHKGVPLHFSPDGVLQQPLYPSDGPA